ncbi:MAG: TIGR03790 family protein [Planctomycetota bacterium]|nr:TIGR03790 family protein [Planctomycetota bacterium]
MTQRCLLSFAAALFLFLFAPFPANALQPDQILLITNKNSPDSQRLAALYAQLRNIPADQTVALDLPDGEEMPFSTYETNVVGALRQYLKDHALEKKVTCFLTFYGVPFRILAKTNSPDERQEIYDLQDRQVSLIADTKKGVVTLEKQAQALDPSFKPATENTVNALDARMRAALSVIAPKIDAIADPGQRQQILTWLTGVISDLGGPVATDLRPNAPLEIRQRLMGVINELHQLQGRRWDPLARARIRTLAAENLGKLGAAEAISQQLGYFVLEKTGSATESELPLLQWNNYPRQNWLSNPLHFGAAPSAVPTYMAMRLDGPNPDIVEKIIRASIDVEKNGLRGTVVIDARGLPPIDAKNQPDPYGEFDERLRQLALMVHVKTKLQVKLDDTDRIIAPHSVPGVALYCGWYSLNHYIPSCDFNPGAVGYHVASYEMIHLHGPQSGWVHGLLTDGVVATLGPVDEPYLTAFPNPDEFFPLLMTGRLTLAEVYWKTTPMTSWMISCIGDPLYTPYKVNPAMQLDDLPPRLRSAVFGSSQPQDPSSEPAQ